MKQSCIGCGAVQFPQSTLWGKDLRTHGLLAEVIPGTKQVDDEVCRTHFRTVPGGKKVTLPRTLQFRWELPLGCELLCSQSGFGQGEWSAQAWGVTAVTRGDHPLQQVNPKEGGGKGTWSFYYTYLELWGQGGLNSIWDIKIMIPPNSKDLEAGGP